MGEVEPAFPQCGRFAAPSSRGERGPQVETEFLVLGPDQVEQPRGLFRARRVWFGLRGCGGRAFFATLRSVHSYRTARSRAAEMIEWIRRIVAGLIGLHTCKGHLLSHVWGRLVRWSRSGPHRWSQACSPAAWCSVFGSLPQSREHFFSAVYSPSRESAPSLRTFTSPRTGPMVRRM